jgi:hypothetical protein
MQLFNISEKSAHHDLEDASRVRIRVDAWRAAAAAGDE